MSQERFLFYLARTITVLNIASLPFLHALNRYVIQPDGVHAQNNPPPAVACPPEQRPIPVGYGPNNNDTNAYSKVEAENIDDISNIVELFYHFGDRWHLTEKMLADLQGLVDRGKIPMLSMHIGDTPLTDVPKHLDELRVIAQQLSALGGPVLWRGLYEPNGNWFSYGSTNNTPEMFVEAFNQISGVLREEAPDNVYIVASLNITSFGAGRYDLLRYIQDIDADIVGLDGYNKHQDFPSVNVLYPDESYAELFSEDIRRLDEATDLPIIITEIGAAEDQAAWFKGALPDILNSDVRAFVVFAWNKSGFGEADWEKMVRTNSPTFKVIRDFVKNCGRGHHLSPTEVIHLITRKE